MTYEHTTKHGTNYSRGKARRRRLSERERAEKVGKRKFSRSPHNKKHHHNTTRQLLRKRARERAITRQIDTNQNRKLNNSQQRCC